jgi:hypothetical protein
VQRMHVEFFGHRSVLLSACFRSASVLMSGCPFAALMYVSKATL